MKILGVTACPTGVAHTYMSAEVLEKEAKARGYEVKVETQGSILLVKLIDASNDLSIQVHPDDKYASSMENGQLGKTEAWYIVDCNKDSVLEYGHNANSKEELVEYINEGKWIELKKSYVRGNKK